MKNRRQSLQKYFDVGLAALALMGCEKTGRSFSILADESNFSQQPTFEVVAQKIDILWVVDNSGSMETSQTALTTNFNRFIQRFQNQNYDFRMAITTSDAYLGKFNNQPSLRRLRDGVGANHSGVFVMDKNTPNLTNVFMTNATQGINGSGDERSFSSFEDVLTYNGNSDFRRADAYLAIINISDEDDFSATTSSYLNNSYTDSRLISVSHYKDFLDAFAGSGNYSFNTISILDATCRDALNDTFTGRRVGTRYNSLADLTGGVKASLCSDFGDSLQLISDSIINQKPANATFKLNREPYVETIVVKLDGVALPEDAVNGWTYDAATMTITLHGSAVTAIQAGATVSIYYDPKTLKN